MAKRKPKSSRERGAWPNKPRQMYFDDPVEVLILLERYTYEWLENYTASRGGCHPLTSSVEVAVATLLRAAARKGITLEWLEQHVFVSGTFEPLWRPSSEGIGKITIDDLYFDGGFDPEEFPEPAESCCNRSTDVTVSEDGSPQSDERRKPETPRERGLWPAYASINWGESVEVLLTLEWDVFEWMEKYLACEAGSSSFTASFEETVGTLIRAAAQGGSELGWVADELFLPGCCEGVEPFEDCPRCGEATLERAQKASRS